MTHSLTLLRTAPDPPPAIDVLILTEGRRPTIHSTVESALRQDYPGQVHIYVVVDSNGMTGAGELPRPRTGPTGRQILMVSVNEHTTGLIGVARIAALRNLALTLSASEYVCFLDDDNEWEPEHLRTLVTCIREARVLAAHSWRRLEADGRPWCPDHFPWTHSADEGRRLFGVYRTLGMMDPNSDIVRDRATALHGGREYGMVDMGEWLFERRLFLNVQFESEFTVIENQHRVGEDDKLLAQIRDRAIPVACTQQATLIYRLGGISNAVIPSEQQPGEQTSLTCSVRALNRKRVKAALAQGCTLVDGLPRALFVELTRFCNLACPMCRSRGEVRKDQRMSRALFDRIADELFEAAELVDLRGWGESLILPEFPERAKRVRAAGCELRIVTNLSFRRSSVLEQLIELEAHVGVSIDAASPGLLRWIRGGAALDLMEANLKLLAEGYRRRGLNDRLCAYVTCQRPAIDELPVLVDLLARAGVTRMLLAPVTVDTGSPLCLEGAEHRLLVTLSKVRERAAKLGIEVGLTASLFEGHWPREDASTCSHPWSYCYITYDGRVGFCDHLIGPHGDPYIMGDLCESSFESIWNGDAWQRLRAEHAGRRRPDAPLFAECAWCYRNRHVDFEHVLDPELAAKRQFLALGRLTSQPL
ncbi:MAG: SPASM domain-containing protein [Phycisphaerales bacterium]|nr:SPASM domain-containing protein [Phycisphaerales bacterium]